MSAISEYKKQFEYKNYFFSPEIVVIINRHFKKILIAINHRKASKVKMKIPNIHCFTYTGNVINIHVP